MDDVTPCNMLCASDGLSPADCDCAPDPAVALYAAEWEVRKAIGVCCDVDYTEGHRAAIKANKLLREARQEWKRRRADAEQA